MRRRRSVRAASPWDLQRGGSDDGANSFDVLVPENQAKLEALIKQCSVVHFGTECKTFSRAREIPRELVAGGGRSGREVRLPRPLRSGAEPAGLADLSESERRAVQKGNAMARITAAAAEQLAHDGFYFIVENPARSWLWSLPEFVRLGSRREVRVWRSHACMFDGGLRKDTAFMSNVDLSEVMRCCSNSGGRCDRTGLPHQEWTPTWDPVRHRAVFPTAGAAEYSRPLCEALAEGIRRAITATLDQDRAREFDFLEVFSGPRAPLTAAVAALFVGRSNLQEQQVKVQKRAADLAHGQARADGPTLVKSPAPCLQTKETGAAGRERADGPSLVMSPAPAAKKEQTPKPGPAPTRAQRRSKENEAAIGGLRSPWRAVGRMPILREVGANIRQVIDAFIDRHPVLEKLPDGGEFAQRLAEGAEVDELRTLVAELLQASSTDRSENGSPWRRKLVEAHVRASKDPEVELPVWLQHGAPIGVALPVKACGVFPIIEETERKETTDIHGILSIEEARANYRSFEEAREFALPEVDRIVQAGYAVELGGWQEVVAKYGPVAVSKLACIVKQRKDGSTKARLVVDLRRSGVNRCVRLEERIILPRVKEVLDDCMYLLAAAHPGDELEAMVADFKDAFHTLPAHPDEHRFGIAHVSGDRYVAFKTIMFGGEASPLVWGRAAAYLMRGAQALFKLTELLIECYVDDPIVLAIGCRRRRRRYFTIFLLWMCILGVPISWGKVSRGRQVEWCGAEIRMACSFTVRAALSSSFVQEFRDEVADALRMPLVKRSALRRLAGRAAWATGLVPSIRSFIDGFWAVLAEMARNEGKEQEAGKALKKRKRIGKRAEPAVQTVRVSIALRWLRAFLSRKIGDGSLSRTADVREWYGQVSVIITCDASPWGLGATLEVHGTIVAYLHDALNECDAEVLGLAIGSCTCQAAAEALAMAVALRTWLADWGLRRTAVKVRSDSQAALGALGKLASPSPAVNAIAREISLDIACSRYGIDVWEHLPGVKNVLADSLSRVAEPGVIPSLPAELAGVSQSVVEKRNRAWWIADGMLASAEAGVPDT